MNATASPGRAQAATHGPAIRRVARRFRPHSYARGYARWKLRFDPAYGAVADELGGSPLPLLDIGCGMGLLGLYLHERGVCGDYLGIDLDPRKIRDGTAAMEGTPPSLRLREGSAGQPPPHRGDVVMLDVLHYMPFEAQHEALHQASERVADNGTLLVRTCLADRGWRYRTTVAEEWLLHASGWMEHDGTRTIPRREQIEQPLRERGFQVASKPLWGLTPYNSHLFVARRDTAMAP